MFRKFINSLLRLILIAVFVLVAAHINVRAYGGSGKARISNDDYIEKAASRRKEGRYEEAALNAKMAVEADPDDPRGYGILAEIYRSQGKYDEAIDQFSKVMELESTSIPNLFGMVRLLDEARGIDAAVQYLDGWIRNNTQHSSRNEAENLLKTLQDAKAAGRTKFFQHD